MKSEKLVLEKEKEKIISDYEKVKRELESEIEKYENLHIDDKRELRGLSKI